LEIDGGRNSRPSQVYIVDNQVRSSVLTPTASQL